MVCLTFLSSLWGERSPGCSRPVLDISFMVNRGRKVKWKLPKLRWVETVGLNPASHKNVGMFSRYRNNNGHKITLMRCKSCQVAVRTSQKVQTLLWVLEVRKGHTWCMDIQAVRGASDSSVTFESCWKLPSSGRWSCMLIIIIQLGGCKHTSSVIFHVPA